MQGTLNNVIPADPTGGHDADNSSFLASLPQQLRHEVLLSADDSFIASLSPEWLAEANAVHSEPIHHGLSLQPRHKQTILAYQNYKILVHSY